MSVACELEFEVWRRPRLSVVPDHSPRFAPPPPRVHRGRMVLAVVLAVVVVTLLVLLALPLRALGGSTLAQVAPARGGEYIVKPGDTLASIAARADTVHAATLTTQLTREVGSSVVVPGEHVFIP